MSGIAVDVADVSKRYRLYHERNQSLKASVMRGRRARYEEFWALRDVSLEVREGTAYGLVGENGSGKSTLLKCMAKILRPDKGAITTDGKVSALLELGAGFHPELSGRENVFLNGSILGLSKKQLVSRFDEIVELRGARAVHRRAGEELLVGHVRPARVLGRDQRRPRHPADRRGARGGRRRVPAALRRQVRRAARAGQDDRHRHPRARRR